MATKTFEVSTMSALHKKVDVSGETLGDLRKAVQLQFDIPAFEQQFIYACGGTPLIVEGDDTVLMKDKQGLLEVDDLLLTRQIDPRYKMEKETAFLDALAASNFKEAKSILGSSGVTIDPNCVRRGYPKANQAVTESPFKCTHPALTVAMMAGIEHAVEFLCNPRKIQAWMNRENEVVEIVEMLIRMGADVNLVGDEDQDCESAGQVTVHGKTPLSAAVQCGSPALVRMLLEAKADANQTMQYDASAWGPDENNPFGPGVLKAESWLGAVRNGSVGKRNAHDPRNQVSAEIMSLLRAGAIYA